MMRSLSLAPLVLALLCTSAGAAAGTPPRAQLRGYNCHTALDPPQRAVSVTAVMRPLSATRRMQLKFQLLVTPDGSTAPPSMARGGDLGSWISPKNPTLGQLSGDVWNFNKSVVELGAPATYRFRVDFRWLGAHNHVIGSAVRYGWRCHQRELRPDLLVQSPIAVSPAPGQPNQDLYRATIDNAGASAAGPFVVQFVPADGSAPQTIIVPRLPAFGSVIEQFTGPLCTVATAPTITADSAREVDDLNRANNSLLTVCPGSVSSGSAAGTTVVGQSRNGASRARPPLYLVKQ